MNRKQISFTLLQTPVHLLYGCTFFILASIIGGWWYYWYAPIMAANNALEQDLHLSFTRMQSQKKSEKLAHDLQRQFSDLKSSVSTSKRDTALCSLVSLAQKNGLSVMNARLGRKQNKSWCNMQEVQAECKGTYDQLLTFFEQLAQQKPIAVCKVCDITRDKDSFAARIKVQTYLI